MVVKQLMIPLLNLPYLYLLIRDETDPDSILLLACLVNFSRFIKVWISFLNCFSMGQARSGIYRCTPTTYVASWPQLLMRRKNMHPHPPTHCISTYSFTVFFLWWLIDRQDLIGVCVEYVSDMTPKGKIHTFRIRNFTKGQVIYCSEISQNHFPKLRKNIFETWENIQFFPRIVLYYG